MTKRKKILLFFLLGLLLFAGTLFGYAYIRLNSVSNGAVPITKAGQADASPLSEGQGSGAADGGSNEGTGDQSAGQTEKEQPSGQEEEENTAISFEEQINQDVFNILLIGSDARDDSKGGRSDTMVICSYQSKKRSVKLISLMRDTLLPIQGHGKGRLNSAYSYGGVGLCINTINSNFGLDLQKYIIIDFSGLTKVIDLLGGVDVPLTAKEAAYYNSHYHWGVKEGVNHLDGDMALKHARNRSLGSDFERTRRQRDILTAVYHRVRENFSFLTVSALLDEGLKAVRTNLSVSEILSLAHSAMSGEELSIVQSRVPADGTWHSVLYRRMDVLSIDIVRNRKAIKDFLYS